MSKILHRQIFRLKILHRQFHLISTVLVRKNTKNEWKWRNLHRWQKFYTATGSDGMDKFHLCLDNTKDSKHASSAILCRQQIMNFSHMIADWNQSDDLGTKNTILQILLTTICLPVSNVDFTIILLCFKIKQYHLVVFWNKTTSYCCVSKQNMLTLCCKNKTKSCYVSR